MKCKKSSKTSQDIEKAQEKIESAGGECVSIDDIMESNPKGSNIRIME